MIIGAGLSGLIAAHAFPRHAILEASPAPSALHKALLRFRSNVVGELTGIEFNPVTVRKGIWLGEGWEAPNIRAANLYSAKVLGRLMDRSIWDLEPVTRYIAPSNFYERLLDSVGARISWGVQADFSDWRNSEPWISTAPMSITLSDLGISVGEEFKRAAITISRFKVARCDVYQTAYFPTSEHSLYRASITGNLLICEFVDEPSGDWMADVERAFALWPMDLELQENSRQNYGKIAPIDEAKRRVAIVKLTNKYNIFSLGRFATWRNILLDDVVHDAMVIKRLLAATDYERSLIRA